MHTKDVLFLSGYLSVIRIVCAVDVAVRPLETCLARTYSSDAMLCCKYSTVPVDVRVHSG